MACGVAHAGSATGSVLEARNMVLGDNFEENSASLIKVPVQYDLRGKF